MSAISEEVGVCKLKRKLGGGEDLDKLAKRLPKLSSKQIQECFEPGFFQSKGVDMVKPDKERGREIKAMAKGMLGITTEIPLDTQEGELGDSQEDASALCETHLKAGPEALAGSTALAPPEGIPSTCQVKERGLMGLPCEAMLGEATRREDGLWQARCTRMHYADFIITKVDLEQRGLRKILFFHPPPYASQLLHARVWHGRHREHVQDRQERRMSGSTCFRAPHLASGGE